MLCDIASDISADDVALFQSMGFYVRKKTIFKEETATRLESFCDDLELVLNGNYDRGRPPLKVNKIAKQYYVSDKFCFLSPSKKWTGRSKTIHLINVWQCSSTFHSLVTNPALGAAVVKLMSWESYGCRVAQDQVWIKPPHSGPLSYHRDTPYIDFSPKEVCTVWIPFDKLSKECGTLEYCHGSHQWTSSRRGSANQFYDNNYKSLLLSAAQEELGEPIANIEEQFNISHVITDLGGCSFHNGNTWHGSDCNTTDTWRRGIGIHFIRGDAVLSKDMGPLWKSLQGSNSCEPSPEAFPKII